MRISTAYANESAIETLQKRQVDLADSQERLTTGKRVMKASDDPAAAARAERALAGVLRAETSQRAVEASRTVMSQTESAMADAEALMQEAREALVAAGNASYSDQERAGVAAKLSAIRQQLMSVANRTDGAGTYLFGGQGASTLPFVDLPGGVAYQGVTGEARTEAGTDLPLSVDGAAVWMSARTGNGVYRTSAAPGVTGAWIDNGQVSNPAALTGSTYTLQFSVAAGATTYAVLKDGLPTAVTAAPYTSGQDITVDGMSFRVSGAPANGDQFTAAPSTASLSVFDTLDGAIAQLGTPGRTKAQIAQTNTDALRDMDQAMGQLSRTRAVAGEVLARIDNETGRLDTQKLSNQTERSKAEDLDMVRAISEFQNKQTGYDAALKSYSMVQRLSLFQYLNSFEDQMLDVAILGQVALGYSPFIDRNRSVTATRLTVFPLRPDAAPDASQLLHAIGGVWPADGGRVSLNVTSEALLQELMLAQPAANVMVEVPAFMACDPANVAAIVALHGNGNTLLLKGRPLGELPREVLPCFKYSIIDLADDRRLDGSKPPPGVSRSITHVQAGVRTLAEMEQSFARGAEAVLGWPIDDVIASGMAKAKTAGQPDMQVMVELIRQVDTEQPIEKLEATLKRDPSLAFKLMRYINSPAFGLRVEISSFRHAIMMLGYKRLKRWLALLLATGSKDVNLKPVMFAAVRRGLLMEELGRASSDEEMRNELFICGVFSLLDRMFQQPFAELLANIPVPAGVFQALAEESGPYQPYLTMLRAIENESLYDFREAADALMMSVSEINRAQLRALTAASQLE